MSNDFRMDTDSVRSSGENQIGIAQDFNGAVQIIFSTIESICASEWLGYSSDTYNTQTSIYRDPMRRLGELIEEHAHDDINSANRVEDTDQQNANMMNRYL